MQTSFSAKRLLLLLLLGDLFFVALHIVLEIPHYTSYPPILELPFYHSYLLTVDGSLAEWFQYIKFGGLIWLINSILRQTREKNYVAWGLFFSFLLLDDSLRFHERMGGFVARAFSFQPPMGLRLKDIGEFLVLGGAGFLLLIALAIAFFRGSDRFKRVSFDIFLLIMSLAFFAVVMDLLHPLYDNQMYRLVMGTMEDAGEMFVVSFILWYVYRLVTASPSAYLHDRIPFARNLFIFNWRFDWGKWLVTIGRLFLSLLNKQTALFALITYIFYIALLTLPVLNELGVTIPGDDGDAYVHLWAFEWVRDTLSSGQSPFYTTLMFFPNGTDLYSHNIPWLNILFWLPLQAIVGSAVAYSLLFLAAFVFNAFSGFWLTRELTNHDGAAFVGGLIIGGWQYTLMQYTKPNLVLLGFVPLAMWAILKLCQTGERKYVALSAVFLAAIGITRFQLLGISLLILMPWTGFCLWHAKNEIGTRIKQLTIAGSMALLAIAPFVFPLIWHQLNRQNPSDLYDTSQVQFVDLLAHMLPSGNHPFLEQLVQPHRFAPDEFYFLGFVPLLLLFVGLRKAPNRGFWLGSFLLLLIFGLGDKLVVNGQDFFNLPYRLTRGTNIDGLVGNPNRFNVLTSIPFGVLVAFGAKGVLAKVERIYRPLLLILLTIYITAEYQTRYKTLDLAAPAWYTQLAQESGDFGILPLPHNRGFSETYLNYQRTHGKGIVEGHVSRVPREAYDFINDVPLLTYLQDNRITAYELEPPTQFINIGEQFDQLVSADIRYMVLHKSFMHVDIINRWHDWLITAPVYEDDEVVVFSTDLAQAVTNLQPISEGVSLANAVNITPNKRSNQTIQLVTHWLLSPSETFPDEVCLTLDVSEACQPFSVTVTGEDQLVRTVQQIKVDKRVQPDVYGIEAQFKRDGALVGESFEIAQAILAGPARLFERPEMAKSADAPFGDELQLLGYDGFESNEQTLALTLYWQARVEKSRHTKYFLHVMDDAGNLVAQIDTAPRGWGYPTTEWASEEIVSDTVMIDITPVQTGDYDVYLGMVDVETGERLLLSDGSERLFLGEIVIQR